MYNTFRVDSGGNIRMNTKSIDELIKDYFRLLLASKGEKRAKQKKRFDTILLYMEGYPLNITPLLGALRIVGK